jgi:hypothetical protein
LIPRTTTVNELHIYKKEKIPPFLVSVEEESRVILTMRLLNRYPMRLARVQGLVYAEFDVPPDTAEVLQQLNRLKTPISAAAFGQMLKNPSLNTLKKAVHVQRLLGA